MPGIVEQLNTALAGRYEIQRVLGAGGMATVFLARDIRHRRSVAIKVLHPELASMLGPERFLREIETAAALSHPHILPLHDSGSVDGLFYYIMPYAAGESLRQRLEREKQLPLADALRIARETADALEHAHRRGVVHRDIKPENILFEERHALVADFGIARAVAAAGGEKLTATGLAIGTPAYMSPEQTAGSEHVDGRSDQYSLGCVLYEMLAGQPPFTGSTAGSLAHQHLSLAPRPVTDLRPTVPGAVDRTLGRALAKTAADRFATAGEFAVAIAHLESQAGTAAGIAAPAPAARRSWRLALFVGVALLVAAAALLVARPGRQPTAPAKPMHGRNEIAVLPFQNLSADEPHAYFADGLHEELLTELAKVAALKVISRTSVMGYQGTAKPLKTIAQELGVGSIVEGSVQVIGDRLRVNVQLIDASTDEHLWAERYDRTLDDAFAIQSDIARQIVAAVGAALNGAEQERLTAAPTANAEAYRLFLQARGYNARPGALRQDRESAEQLYERALTLDPNFALAHAEISQVHGQMYFMRYDPSERRAARQREEAETALRLAPDLPEAHVAMGRAYYQAEHDYRRALDEFAIALRGMPHDADLWRHIGSSYRRLGSWNEAAAAFEKAIELNPRDADLFLTGTGPTNRMQRRYADAVRAYDQALRLAPDLHVAAIDRAWVYVRWQGTLDTLRAVLNRIPKEAELGFFGDVPAQRAELALWQRDSEGLLQTLRAAHRDAFDAEEFYLPSALYAAWAYRLRGDQVAARAAFDSARVLLESTVRSLPEDARVHAALGLALAGLGRRDEALAEAGWLQQTSIYREDAFQGPSLGEDRAKILAQVGQSDAALDEISRLLARPSLLNIQTLRLDPLWDPIREHPGFKALLAKYASGAAR